MTSQTIAELLARGQDLEKRLRDLGLNERSPAFAEFVDALHPWLQDCVAFGRFLAPGSPQRRSLQGQVDYWTSRLLQAGHPFDDIDRIAAFDASAGRVLPDEAFPYHGLVAVTEAGRDRFFGRDEQIKEYADHLDQHPALLILSESGGGKSSVAMAGVLPELQRRHPDWLVLPRVVPGNRPADTLRDAVAGTLGLAAGSAPSLDAAALAQALGRRTLLIYVDQLEELLTMCTDAQQQAEFSTLLVDSIGLGGVRLLTTMRIDHYERLAHSAECHPLYATLTRDGSAKTLPPLSLAQIRSVILRPAEQVGLRFVPASIVENLASETANASSGLPLLQFALQRLWLERPGAETGQPLDLVTDATYAKLPTLRTALSSLAEAYYAGLVAQGLERACQRLMLELTVIDERLEVPLRRRRRESEVLAVLAASGAATPQQAQALVDGFVERRLMVRTGGDGETQIEVAHEALFRYWDRFQKWFNSDEVRTTLRETRRLERDALMWQQKGRSGDHLKLKGEPLDKALEFRQAHWLDPLTVEYVEACKREIDEQLQRDIQAKQARDDARHQRTIVRRSWAIGGTVVAVLVAFIFVKRHFDAKEAETARINAQEKTDLVRSIARVATNTVASLVRDLNPLAALDLAHTLQMQNPEGILPLAHAIDRLGDNARLVGPRGSDKLGFTADGNAILHIAPAFGGKGLQALIVPIGPDDHSWKTPVQLDLQGQPGETLASLSVGPPIAAVHAGGPKEQRLVIASFVGAPRDGPSSGPLVWTRMQIFRIVEDQDGAKGAPAERSFPAGTVNASAPDFDASGLGVVVSSWQSGAPSPNARSVVLKWDEGKPQAPAKELPSVGAGRVTAAAFDGQGRLLLGHDDGSVTCGNGSRIGNKYDKSTVLAIRSAWGSDILVAQHASKAVVVGDCGRHRGPYMVETAGEVARNLTLSVVNPKDPTVQITYNIAGKLVCMVADLNVEHTDICWGDGLSIDAAVPAMDNGGKLLGYHVLDSTEPLLSFLRSDETLTEDTPTVMGLPVVRAPNEPGDSHVAVSPNGGQRIGIRVDRKQRVVFWPSRAQNDRALDVPDVPAPDRATINDAGTAVVSSALQSDRATINNADAAVLSGAQQLGKTLGVLHFVARDREAKSMQLDFIPSTCLKMSPDGSRVLVAGAGEREWSVQLVQVGTDAPAPLGKAFTSSLGGATLTACALGSGPDATLVLAQSDGTVRYGTPDKQGTYAWRPVSLLVGFRLPGPALDVSIDAGSRFVAAVGERVASGCAGPGGGHPFRVWDLHHPAPRFPMVSTCLPGRVQAVGTPVVLNNRWVVPVYGLRNGKYERFNFPCLACEGQDKAEGVRRRLTEAAKPFDPRLLSAERVKALYGFDLE